jgi:hypothetical protein
MFIVNEILRLDIIKAIETNTYYPLSFIKGSQLRYARYLELIYRCLLDDMYIELTCMRIIHEEITRIYGKTHVIVV